METFGVAEAKRRFGELLDRVSRGERFVIQRRGKPVVALVPPQEIGEEKPEPKGLLSLVGIAAEWGWSDEDVDEMVRDIYRARRRSKDRPVPDLG